jgi:hypothetical protein
VVIDEALLGQPPAVLYRDRLRAAGVWGKGWCSVLGESSESAGEWIKERGART